MFLDFQYFLLFFPGRRFSLFANTTPLRKSSTATVVTPEAPGGTLCDLSVKIRTVYNIPKLTPGKRLVKEGRLCCVFHPDPNGIHKKQTTNYITIKESQCE